MGQYWLELLKLAWADVRAQSPAKSVLSLGFWLCAVVGSALAPFFFTGADLPLPYATLLSVAFALLVTTSAVAWKLAEIPPKLDTKRVEEIGALREEITKLTAPDPREVQRLAQIASFTKATDEENKLAAIDEVRRFHSEDVLRTFSELNAVRGAISRVGPDTSEEERAKLAADVHAIRDKIAALYQQAGRFRKAFEHYPALQFPFLYNEPDTDVLTRHTQLLALALTCPCAGPHVHFHQNEVWLWLQQCSAWWGRANGEAVAMRKQISGG